MSSHKWYAVRKGRNPGLYTNWTDTQQQVKGYSGAVFKSFNTKQDAEYFVAGYNNTNITFSSNLNNFNNINNTNITTNSYKPASTPNLNTDIYYNNTNITTNSYKPASTPTQDIQSLNTFNTSSNKYYVVIIGRKPGIYTKWYKAQAQIDRKSVV